MIVTKDATENPDDFDVPRRPLLRIREHQCCGNQTGVEKRIKENTEHTSPR